MGEWNRLHMYFRFHIHVPLISFADPNLIVVFSIEFRKINLSFLTSSDLSHLITANCSLHNCLKELNKHNTQTEVPCKVKRTQTTQHTQYTQNEVPCISDLLLLDILLVSIAKKKLSKCFLYKHNMWSLAPTLKSEHLPQGSWYLQFH